MDMLKTPSGGSASAGGHIFLLQQPGDGGPQLRCAVVLPQQTADFGIRLLPREAEVVPVVQAQVQMVEELDDTARGAGGFGSTGR